MSQSVVVNVSQAGKEIKNIELSVADADLGTIMEKLRQAQAETNKFLTELISDSGCDDKEIDNEDDEEEESDSEAAEPDNKVPKLQ